MYANYTLKISASSMLWTAFFITIITSIFFYYYCYVTTVFIAFYSVYIPRGVDLGGPSVYQGGPKFEIKHSSRCLQKKKLVKWRGQACRLGGQAPPWRRPCVALKLTAMSTAKRSKSGVRHNFKSRGQQMLGLSVVMTEQYVRLYKIILRRMKVLKRQFLVTKTE